MNPPALQGDELYWDSRIYPPRRLTNSGPREHTDHSTCHGVCQGRKESWRLPSTLWSQKAQRTLPATQHALKGAGVWPRSQKSLASRNTWLLPPRFQILPSRHWRFQRHVYRRKLSSTPGMARKWRLEFRRKIERSLSLGGWWLQPPTPSVLLRLEGMRWKLFADRIDHMRGQWPNEQADCGLGVSQSKQWGEYGWQFNVAVKAIMLELAISIGLSFRSLAIVIVNYEWSWIISAIQLEVILSDALHQMADVLRIASWEWHTNGGNAYLSVRIFSILAPSSNSFIHSFIYPLFSHCVH